MNFLRFSEKDDVITLGGIIRMLNSSIDVKTDSSVTKEEINNFINEFGQMPIQKITKKAYRDTIDMLANKFSTNYLSSIHTSANMVFEYAHETKLIKEIPTKDIKLPKKKKTVSDLEKGDDLIGKFLEKEELEEFLTVTKNEGLEGNLLSFAMLAYTGMRIGEIIALKWSDIDFENYTLKKFKIGLATLILTPP